MTMIVQREMVMKLVHKQTAGKRAGSLTYVLSDSTRDRYGDIIEPAGWDLAWFKRNPIALFNHNANTPIGTWDDVRVEDGRLLAEFEPAKPGTSQVADDTRKLIDQDILRATSVGFRAIEQEPLDPEHPWRGVRYKQQELLECSIVSVPANPAALNIAKSLHISDKTLSLAFGGHALAARSAIRPGGHAASAIQSRAAQVQQPNISQHIVQTQEALNRARDTAATLAAEEEPDIEQAEALAQEVVRLERKLTGFEQLERALATRTVTTDPREEMQAQLAAQQQRKPLGIALKEPSKADLLIRGAVCHVLARVTGKDPLTIMDERYKDHEATEIIVRAAMTGGKTTVAGWAAELVDEVTAEFLGTLAPIAAFPRLAAMGTPLTFGPGAGAIRIPSRAATPSISGSFVSEGSPIPVRRIGLTSIQLLPHKMGVISVFSRELARYSNPQIEGLLRGEIMTDTAITIDTLLLDPAAASTARPAGLTNGVAGLTASALGGYKAILADIQTLAAPFDAANAGRSLALLLNKAQARLLAMSPGPDGTFGWANGFMAEFGLIVSTTIPAGHVYMIDAADFVSVSGGPEFEVSEQAVLHMEDTTPLDIGTAGSPATVAAPAQSMFQTAQLALRLLMDMTWAMRRTGMVQHIAAVNWVPT